MLRVSSGLLQNITTRQLVQDQKSNIQVGQTFIFAGTIHEVIHVLTVPMMNAQEIITRTEDSDQLFPWHPNVIKEIIERQWKYK